MSAERPTPDPASVEAARARDRLTAVAAMAELIGHKVRNRLASFRAVLELLQAGWEQNLSAESRASALRQFEAFVRDFNFGLDMIRSDFGRPEPTSVSDLVAEALAYFRTRAPKVRLQVEIEPGLKPVSTDRRLLLLVLLNLLRNAAEAAAEVPDARLRLRAAQSSRRRPPGDRGQWTGRPRRPARAALGRIGHQPGGRHRTGSDPLPRRHDRPRRDGRARNPEGRAGSLLSSGPAGRPRESAGAKAPGPAVSA